MKIRYLETLAELYPTIAKASSEIINLQAILNLPKGTEHFLTDIHGEYEAFSHVLKNGSGSVRRKIKEVFGHTLSEREQRALATLIYYPKEKMDLVRKQEPNMEEWYKITLYRLIEVCKNTASKYTRSKVRKALPEDFAYVIEELITERSDITDKESYYEQIIHTIIEIGCAEKFIVDLSELIQRLVVDHLHVLGDIYDRGPGPHKIMDVLENYHSVDIQWGNHDIVWMGAATGQACCIATVIRNCVRYSNLDILEDGYGINLLPLATFAMTCYKDDPCSCFRIKGHSDANPEEQALNMKMRFLLKKGSLYKIYNRNLLYHGCVPLNEDGSFKEVEVYGSSYKGKALYDILETYVRKAFVAIDKEEKEKGKDILWVIWAGPSSPVFGKDKMATFERCLRA